MTAWRPMVVGNWKMNGLGADVAAACEIAEALRAEPPRARAAICAPATLIERLARAVRGSALIIGAEDVHPEPDGPFTGDVSAAMLADAGAQMVIVGHSERRRAYGETDELVARKALAAANAGLEPIICVGETKAQRGDGQAFDVVRRQVARSIPEGFDGRGFAVAYEPVWAIGADRAPPPDEIEVMHDAIREVLLARQGRAGADVPILYGGSVTPANAGSLPSLANVGGALVGRAARSVADFLGILRSIDRAAS